jgi:GNAT superfamily N-acetyltransferase
MRAFLRDVLLANERRLTGWHVLRWDYWRWHGILNCAFQDIRAVTHLWEDAAGIVRAAVTSDGPGTAFFQVHPAADDPGLRADMLDVAEAHGPDDRRGPGRPPLEVWAPGADEGWAALLAGRGYRRSGTPEDLRAAPLTGALPDTPLADGYRIRPLGGDEDFPSRGDLSLVVFHPEPDGSTAMTAADYRNVQRCPLYRRDLDLVAVAPDGALAGFTTAWFDDVTRTGFFEPVGVHPAHRRLGLGRALLGEAMRRLAWYGAEIAYTASYGSRAGALYESVGLVSRDRLQPWEPGSAAE